MMEVTDRHFRRFLRILSPEVVLYTEMVTTGTLLHGESSRFLRYHPSEHPVALQLGGSDPQALAESATMGVEAGYDEINLNVGCPSDRVKEGRFGACLMDEPALVAECVRAMRERVEVPVTVKTRLGIDEKEDYDRLCDFIEQQRRAGCPYITLHARKAWLQGLSPKQNREVPPLRYDWVHRIAKDFPDLGVEINGGLKTTEAVEEQWEHVHSVMIGRIVQDQPWILTHWSSSIQHRDQSLEAFEPHVLESLGEGIRLRTIVRHLLGLFSGCAGARRWRQLISRPDLEGQSGWRELRALARELDPLPSPAG